MASVSVACRLEHMGSTLRLVTVIVPLISCGMENHMEKQRKTACKYPKKNMKKKIHGKSHNQPKKFVLSFCSCFILVCHVVSHSPQIQCTAAQLHRLLQVQLNKAQVPVLGNFCHSFFRHRFGFLLENVVGFVVLSGKHVTSSAPIVGSCWSQNSTKEFWPQASLLCHQAKVQGPVGILLVHLRSFSQHRKRCTTGGRFTLPRRCENHRVTKVPVAILWRSHKSNWIFRWVQAKLSRSDLCWTVELLEPEKELNIPQWFGVQQPPPAILLVQRMLLPVSHVYSCCTSSMGQTTPISDKG